MKYINALFALTAIFLLCIPAALAKEKPMRFGKIRDNGVYKNEFELHYNARNDGSKNIEGAKITLWIPDLDYTIRTSTFDLDKKQKHGSFLVMDMDELEEGTYLTRMTLSSDYEKKVKWIWMTIE